MIINEYEEFFADIRDSGAGTFEITIPIRIAKAMGLQVGSRLKVLIKKSDLNVEKNE
jgi:hypothetical protein